MRVRSTACYSLLLPRGFHASVCNMKVIVTLPEKEFKASKHVFVPKHEIVPKEEIPEILARYHATLEQLPYILTTDPNVVELGAKPGDVIKITRKSETAGVTEYYRLVVEG